MQKRTRLSSTQKKIAVLAYLDELEERNESLTMTREQFSKATGLSIWNLRQALGDLKENGYINIVTNKGQGGGQMANTYHMTKAGHEYLNKILKD